MKPKSVIVDINLHVRGGGIAILQASRLIRGGPIANL